MNIRLTDEIRNQRILGWLNAGSRLKAAQLLQVLFKFKQNAEKASALSRLYRRLQGTTAGQVMHSFNKWRNIPESSNLEKVKKAHEFEHKMLRLFQNNFQITWGPFKDLYYEGINKKRRAGLLLLKSQ